MRRTTMVAACGIIAIAGCTAIPYQDAFPSQYRTSSSPSPETDQLEDFMLDAGLKPMSIKRPIAKDVLASLPTDFQLANEAGVLSCLFDEQGKFKTLTLSKDSKPSFVHADEGPVFRRLAREVRKSEGNRWVSPVGYPNVMCFIPDVELDTLFDDDWFDLWASFLSSWQEKEIGLRAKKELLSSRALALQNLANQISAVNQERTVLSSTIVSLGQRKIYLEDQNSRLLTTIANVRASRGAGSEKLASAAPPPKPSPFDPKLPWDQKRDPFMDVVYENFTDISEKPWVVQKTLQGKISGGMPIPSMHPDLVKALDDLNELLNSPEKLTQSEKDFLKETGFSLKNKVNEAVRTPWIQAIRGVKEKEQPVAQYLSTDHLFGIAADMNIKGEKYDRRVGTPESIAAWGKVENFLNSHGLYFSAGAGDAVHIGLTPDKSQSMEVRKAAKSYDLFKLKMLIQYRQAALDDITFQRATTRTLLVVAKEQEEKFAKAEVDLNAAVDARDKLAAEAEKIQSVVNDLASLNQTLQTRLNAATRASQRRGGGGGGGRPRGGGGDSSGSDSGVGQAESSGGTPSTNTGNEVSTGISGFGGDSCPGCQIIFY